MLFSSPPSDRRRSEDELEVFPPFMVWNFPPHSGIEALLFPFSPFRFFFFFGAKAAGCLHDPVKGCKMRALFWPRCGGDMFLRTD